MGIVMSKSRLAILLLAAASAAPSHVAAAPPAAAAQPVDEARDAIAAVRRATGVAAMERQPYGIVIGEADDAALIGRRGQLRRGGEIGFDGELFWHFDERRQAGVPLNLKQFEKLAWPLWVRGGWWLSPKSGIVASVVAEETDPRTIALRLMRPGGIVPATVYVDRATSLPARLVVPYDRGPMTIVYSDWRPALGGKLPFAPHTTSR